MLAASRLTRQTFASRGTMMTSHAGAQLFDRRQRRDERRDGYHSTAQHPILVIFGAVAVAGLGYVAYKKLVRGDASVMPMEAVRAMDAYREQQDKLLLRNETTKPSSSSAAITSHASATEDSQQEVPGKPDDSRKNKEPPY